MTKEEQEAIYREEVRKKLDEEEAIEISESEEELTENHNGAEFDAFL